MPSELLIRPDGSARVDLDLQYPPFNQRILEGLARCKQRGALYYFQRGTADFDYQDNLHKLYLAGKGGRAAPAGDSQHNYGLADDFTFDAQPLVPGLQPRWEVADYAILKQEMEALGLVSGGKFGDWPHVGWPGFETAHELAPLKAIYLATPGTQHAKLQACWAYLDAHTIKLPAIVPIVA